jgi:RNA polymerase sigma-70 factor (ECF subfamily)
LAWRKRRQRDRLVMSEEFLTAVSRELIDEAERLDERNRLLAGCLRRLPDHHRELLKLRYTEGGSIETIAAALHRSADAVYRKLSRIRQSLAECVSQTAGAAA